MELAQKCAINEKFTIFVQFWSNFVKRPHGWVSQLDKVWRRLHQNCGFFTNSHFEASPVLYASVSTKGNERDHSEIVQMLLNKSSTFFHAYLSMQYAAPCTTYIRDCSLLFYYGFAREFLWVEFNFAEKNSAAFQYL